MKPFVVPLVVFLSLTGISAALLYVLLKKDEDEDFEPTVYTARQTVIKMKIPKDLIGVLIGRGGANIRLIQQESGARACFDRCEAADAEYRECTIYGTAVTAQRAETLIHEFILSQPKIETLEMTVHQKNCGRIIGRGGQNIRHISNTSHAKIVLTDDVDSEERTITIKGTSDQIAMARDLILNTIKEYDTSLEELRDTIQNRSPRVTPKFHVNGVPKVPPNFEDSRSEILTPPGGDKSLEVFVSAVVNPGQFWVQVINENGTKLDKLLDDMTEYYNNPENKELHTLSKFDEGQIVAAMFPADEKWYRAEIVSVKENDEKKKEIEVFYVDYGDCRTLEDCQVMELRTDFLTLRFQAIECFLSGVKPINDKWSDEAVDLFETLSHVAEWLKLVVVIKTYENRNKSSSKQTVRPVPGVELFDTRENCCINIGEELLKAGFAQRNDDFDSSDIDDLYVSHSTSKTSQYRAVPELSDSGSDIDGFYIES